MSDLLIMSGGGGSGSGGSGTVTSVGFEGDGVLLSSTESGPVTSAGILSASLNTQSANLVFAGPTSGSAAAPTFRSLTLADLPATEGSGSKIQLTNSGTTTSGDVVTYDSSGNVQDSGTLLSSLAPLASPTFTGTATLPTVTANGVMTFMSGTTAGLTITSTTTSQTVAPATANQWLVLKGNNTTTTAGANIFLQSNQAQKGTNAGSFQSIVQISGSFTPSSGSCNFYGLQILPSIGQLGTSSGNYAALLINPTETAVLGAGPNMLIDCQVGSTRQWGITNKGHEIMGAANNDGAGVLTFASSTTVSKTYASPYASTPVVVITPVNPGAVTVTLTSSSSTGFTLTASSSTSISVNYMICGNPN